MKLRTKLLSVFLAVLMIVGVVPFSTFAAMATPSKSINTVITDKGAISVPEVKPELKDDLTEPVATSENVAKVGNTEYATIDEAIANWTNGTTLTLLANVTLSNVIQLSSTEHHILDLGTYTMTAASGKHAIEITCDGRSSASYALTVNADAENPGGITATGKACIYYSKSGSTKDRPIIRIYNGVFNGSYSINSKSNGNTNCPQIWIYGGTFNGNVNLTKNMLRVFGGTFNGWINCTGDSSAYREISGGKFKSWQFMTADADSKFWVGTSKANYNVGAYVDDEGYLVVGGDVVTEAGEEFEASSANYSGWSSYLKYSSVATNGLYYTSVEEALADNNKTNGSVTVYVDELDMAGINYKGTIVVPEGNTLNITNAPDDLKVTNEDGDKIESIDGVYSTTLVTVSTYEQLLAALTQDNANILLLNDITATATQSSGYGVAGIVLDAGDVLNGNGHKLTINGANATWDCAIAMRGGEVKNLTIAGAMRGVFMPGANGDVVIDNCKFEDVIYTFNSDAGSKDYSVTIKDTKLNGWTSFSNVHKAVVFEQCTFGEGSGYAFCRPYQPTSFVDCDFNAGYQMDTAQAKLEFSNCTYDGEALSFANSEMFYNREAPVIINGAEIDLDAVAQIGEQYFETLADAIAAVKNGETIVLLADIAENVTLTEKVGLYYTIDGNGKTMTGTITVTSLSDTDDNRRITIKNIKFVDTTDANVDFISSVNTNHYPRLTVEGCTFTGSGNNGDVALRLKSSHSVIIKDCTGTGLHSFLQNTSGWNLTIENVKVTDSKSGFALGTVQGVTVKGCDITVREYGVRMDAQYNNNAVIESNTINAFIPVVVRKAEVASTVTFTGTNTMTATNTDGLWCAIGTSEYEENGKMPSDPTGKITVTLADSGLNREGIYSPVIALDGEGTVENPYLIKNVADFIFFAKQTQNGNSYSGKVVKLAADIDFNGANYLEIAEDGTIVTDYRLSGFSGTFDGGNYTIKNFNFVVKCAFKGYIMMFSSDGGYEVIRNLKIENVNVNVADITGQTRITALANRLNVGGKTGAAVENVHIKNYTINCTNTTSSDLRIGGFAYFAQGSQLVAENCSIENFTVNANSAIILGGAVSIVKSKCDFINVDVINAVFNIGNMTNVAGGFAGQTQDNGTGTTFTDCDVNVHMNFGTIATDIGGFVASIGAASQFYNCTTSGTINVTGATGGKSIGGFVGDLGWNGMGAPNTQHEFNNCVADVDITAPNANVGGFIGDSTITGYPERFIPAYFNNCEAKGDVKTVNGVAGGFAGRGDRGIFNNCSASGDVAGRIAGGFWGELYPKSKAESTGGWGYDKKEVTHTDANAKSIVLEGIAATGEVTGTEYEAGFIGYMKDIYVGEDGYEKGYATPVILNNNEASGINRYNYSENIHKVATKAELNAALAAAKDGDAIILTADIDYGTDQLAIAKAITLDLGGYTLTTRNAWGGMSIKGNATVKNGTIVHASNTAAIKVWNATAFENLVIDVQGKGDANKTIGGIVLQSGSTTRVGSIKNVTIKGAALTNGIETYNCGDATENVIGSLENVNIDALGTAMLISAPVGTATGCTFKGGVNAVELWIKGNYSATLTLADCDLVGGVYAHDEFNSNPTIVNNGTLSLTVDKATTGADDITVTIARAENLGGVVKEIVDNAQAKVNDTYYATLAEAIKAAKAGDVVTVFAGTYAMPSMKAGITIVGEGKVVFEGTLSGTLENLTLKNIYIKGANAQRWAYAKGDLVFENVTFEATSIYALHFDGITAGTTLTYKNCTIIGWAAMSGSPASCVFEGCTFKGNGTYGLIRTYFDATLTNCTFDVANVNTNDNYQDGIHAVSGAEVTVDNCTNIKGDMTAIVNVSGSSVVVLDGVEIKNLAKIGDTYYASLEEAFAAAQAGETIVLLAPVVVAAGETLTLNKAVTITYTSNVPGEDMITVRGKLIVDGATLVYNNNDASANNVTVSTISCEPGSVLEVKSGKVVNESANRGANGIYAYAIDLLTNGSLGNVTVTISGGEVISENYMAIRQFNNGTVCANTLNITGGYIYGAKRAIQVHLKNNAAYLTISGGKIEAGAGGYALCLFPENATHISVTGGQFIGTVYSGTNGFVSGGTFDAEVYSGYLAEGLTMTKNADGTYGVVKTTVTISSVEELMEFAAAVTGNTLYQGVKVAANSKAVVLLTADLDLTDSGFLGIGNGAANAFSGTFDGQGHVISNMTLSCNYYRGVGFFRSLGSGAVVKNLTFVNANVNNGAATASNHFYGVVAGFSANLTLDNVNVKDSSVTCKYSGAVMVGCLENNTVIKNSSVENVDVKTNDIRAAVYGIIGNSASGHTITLENNTVSDATLNIKGEVKKLSETVGYGSWNAGQDYAEKTYVAQIGDKKYSTLVDAINAATEGQTITLIGDVELTTYLTIGKSITLDLGIYNITREGATALYVNGDVVVTITGTTGQITGQQALYVNSGLVKINGGFFHGSTNDGVAVYVINTGKVEIYGGEFSTDGTSDFVLNEYDATRDATSIIVYGGTFVGFNPADNAAEGAGTNFVAPGIYRSIEKDGKWIVGQYVAVIDGNYYETLAAAIKAAQAGETVKLLADITIAATNGGYSKAGVIISGEILDGNGHTLTVTGANGTWDCGIYITAGTVKNITVKGAFRGIFTAGASADIYLDNVNFENVVYTFNSDGGNKQYGVYISNSTINGWTSFSDVHKEVVFTNCSFGNGSGYAFCRPYSTTVFNGCTFSADYEIDGSIAQIVFQNMDAETVGALVGGAAAIIKRNNDVVTFVSFTDAFEAAQDGDIITLLADVALATGITNTKKVTLDLNGKTITGTDNATGNFGLITNKSELTITGNGKMTLAATNNRGWNAYSSVISNTVGGTLIVNGGTIEHLGGTDMAYAIDNLTNGEGTYAETVINDGTIKSTYRAIRQFLNGVEAQNILTVNGGTIEGANKSIWMQDPSKNANTGTLTVGAGATINGDIYLTVTEGSTEWPVEVSIAASAVNGNVLTSNVPAKYVLQNVDGIWSISRVAASINGVKYVTLAEAVKAAKDGQTITLLDDVTLTGGHEEDTEAGLLINKYITIDGNGHTIDCGNFKKGIRVYDKGNVISVTFKNVTIINNNDGGRCIDTRTGNLMLTLTNVELIAKGTNSQPLTIGGSDPILAVSVQNTKIDAGNSGYGIIVFVPNTSTFQIAGNSEIKGLAAIYVKADGANLFLGASTLIGTNNHAAASGNFGTIVVEGNNNKVHVTSSANVKAVASVGANQSAIYFKGADNEVKVDNINNLITDGEFAKAVATCEDACVFVEHKSTKTFATYATLKDAIAAAKAGETIVLLKDVTLSEILTINKAITLDGNGKTLTSTAARAINVSGANGVTIKNLTINASGERAINIIQGATNVTIDNVTATAANYAVNVASSAANAVVTINSSKLTGLAVVNVAAKDAKISIDNTKITNVDANKNERYGAITISSDGKSANVTVNGGEIVVADDSCKAIVFPADADVTGTGDVHYIVATIGAAGYDTLASAIAGAKDGETIVLIRDIALDAGITNTKKITLDLNGKTITGTDNATGSFALITNKSELTITGNGKMTLVATNDRDWNAYSSVISNTVGGKLIVNGGTIEHLGGTDMAYAIDNLTNGEGTYAETVINGGTIKSTYRAIRQFLNGVNAQNILTVSGGIIEGTNKAIWMQDPSKNANSGKLTVGEKAVINGDIYLTVTEGSTEWPVEISIAASAVNGEVLTSNVPDGYVVKSDSGVYIVHKHSYASEVTDPTYDAQGYTTYTCTVCGYYYVDNYVDALTRFEIDMTNTRFGSDFSLMFALKQSKLESLKGVYAIITHNGTEYKMEASKWTTLTISGVKYYVVEYAGIAAKQMGEKVSVAIYDADGNRISEHKTTSILDYATQKLANTTNAKFKTALVDMLNYGAAAQVKFEYNTDALVNAGLTEAQKNLASELKSCDNDRVVTGAEEFFKGSNLRFQNKINLMFAFDQEITRDTYAVFTWTDHKGKAHKVIIEGDEYDTSKGMFIVELDQLVVADARQLVTCTIYDSNGAVIVSVQDSVESNVARVSAANKALYESFMKFADSAYAYLH